MLKYGASGDNMGLKEVLKGWKEELLETISSKNNEKNSSIETLDAKVEEFIAWYQENLVKGYYTESGEYKKPRELRNLIEKMAVWYELRYPKYFVNKIMPGSELEAKDVSACMFQQNPYINEQLDENSEVRILDWENFYNFDAFLASLPYEERRFFEGICYRGLLYLGLPKTSAHLRVDKDGYVQSAEGVSACLNYKISDKQLKGLHVKRIVGMLKFEKFPLSPDNELEEAIRYADNWYQLRKGILDCAMYRIMERGGNRIGPRRGLLFAKEFKRDIDIPMRYGVDTSDPGLRILINEYLKAGGSKKLICYKDYFSRTDEKPQLETIDIATILDYTDYTEEENILHQRLATALSTHAEDITFRKERAKQLRIERKLEKSRRNS